MNSPALLVLCLLVWVPTVSSAQSAEAPTQASDAPTLPPLVAAPGEPEEPPRAELIPRRRVAEQGAPDLFVPRLLLSPILGGVGTTCGAVLGLILGIMIDGCAPFDGGCNDWALVVPTAVMGWAAGSLSVYGMGSFLNGQGELWPTMLGGALGTGLSIAIVASGADYAWISAPLSPAIGAVVGYEISNSLQRSALEEDAEAGTVLQLMPVVGRTPEGGILGGLMGRF